MDRRRTRLRAILAAAAPLAAMGVFAACLQRTSALRFELGSMDRDYLRSPDEFHSGARMDGPFRHPDGSVERIAFYGRLSTREAGVRLPYWAFRSPLRIWIRCHRFGLGGAVRLTVNQESIAEFQFGETSYPWGGIEAVIPQETAERGPLEIELSVIGGSAPPSHLPPDIGLGIDWIEIQPMSKAVRLRPLLSHLLLAGFSALLAFVFVIRTGGSARAAVMASALVTAAIGLATAFFPAPTLQAVARLWIWFPLGLIVYEVLRRAASRIPALRLDSTDASFLSRIVVLGGLAHSLLIFFPDHAPPGLWNHLPQVEWLRSFEWSAENLRRFSTSHDVFDDPHVRPRFGTEYGAPYPPFFYFLTSAMTGLHDDSRFSIEFLSVVLGCVAAVSLFLLVKVLWKDGLAARLAALLLMLEISLWHHVHRVHSPGILGEVFVLLFLLLLALGYRRLATGSGVLILAAAAFAATLSYTAVLVQLVLMMTFVILQLVFSRNSQDRALALRLATGFGIGLAAAFAVYYGPYAATALEGRELILDREAYRPPATFLFLRNQMRDTVRILRNGYPFLILLSIPGWWLLSRNPVSPFHRRVLVAGVLTYLTMLVLKDPVFLPRVFLHAKEDLFYAPFACALAAVAAAALWRRFRFGPMVVVALFIVIFALSLRDHASNANTLRDGQLDFGEN